MKFKDTKFNGKRDVRKTVKHNIFNFLKRELPIESKYNQGYVFEYIDFLLDETDYNFKRDMFYYKVNYVKIDLPVKLLKNVALEYIKEHETDFLLETEK